MQVIKIVFIILIHFMNELTFKIETSYIQREIKYKNVYITYITTRDI